MGAGDRAAARPRAARVAAHAPVAEHGGSVRYVVGDVTSEDDVALLPYYLALASLRLAKDRSLPAADRDPQDLQVASELADTARRICTANRLDEEPIAQNTLAALAPLVRRTLAFVPTVSADPSWKIQTEFGSP